MGQLVSDVTDILDYKDAKKSAKTQRQEIIFQQWLCAMQKIRNTYS